MSEAIARQCTTEDIPWLLELAQKCYGPEIEDIAYIKRWIESTAGQKDILFIRSEHSALVCTLLHPFYAPSKVRASTVFITGDHRHPWETLTLLRIGRKWAEMKGCRGKRAFVIDSATEYDISPLALRLGAKPSPTFALEIT